ncbi:NAD-dependent epimerase/dehydratase family protein [Gorillibacterium massiliense]|uniref:NAD-dependent epimerase/dehydratase family protein n=1 Tax=Gorillibacterium massiliense TaxID=1280390 RepID=UPI0004B41897|nr:NAD-dependent epimerase/dehydratase family protein [Gorillibacterium massiliense]
MNSYNCLLLGGGGFIGLNLAEQLYRDGHKITIYDRNTKEKELPTKFSIIEGDFYNENNYDEIIKNHDIVIHLISSVFPSSSMDAGIEPYHQDITKMLELLDACRKAQLKRVIFLSSGGTVYGNSYERPIRETDLTDPINHYGILKLTLEKILLMYNQLYGMENLILRIANPYGKNQNPEKLIGAISVFLHRILHDEPITLFGGGQTIRDYIEISDVCNAIELALSYNYQTHTIPVFNIGTGTGTSVIQVIEELELLLRKKAVIRHVPERAIDVKYNVLDGSKSKTHLSFQAKVQVSDGIAQLVHYFKVK